jgi:hypothetical protein
VAVCCSEIVLFTLFFLQSLCFCDCCAHLIEFTTQNATSLGTQQQQQPLQHDRPVLFRLADCERAASSGVAYVMCGDEFPVALHSLCPDVLVSSDLPVVRWDEVSEHT